MLYTIPINKQSIKRNKNAGDTCSIMSTGQPQVSITLTTQFNIKLWNLALNKRMSVYDVGLEFVMSLTIEGAIEHSDHSVQDFLIKYHKPGKLFSLSAVNKLLQLNSSFKIIQADKGTHSEFQLNTDYPHQRVYHAPIPEYSYDYENITIMCSQCNATFSVDQLDDDEDIDGSFCDTVCPKCGANYCCDIEYEVFSKAMVK